MMKTRIISAVVALIIFIPLLLIGGLFFDIAVFVLACLGLREFLNIRSKEKKIPLPIQAISYLSIGLIFSTSIGKGIYEMDLARWVTSLIALALLIPVLFYFKKGEYSVEDALATLAGTLFLGFIFAFAVRIRYTSLPLLIYLLLITTMTDTFAFVTGILIGKHPMSPNISPKKTWEGLAGGLAFGVLISTVFYINVINPEVNLWIIILGSLFLCLLGQFGDLFFSCLKRTHDQKDFSNLMPGHGGVLDRFDSLIFVILGFTLFVTFI